MLHPIRSIACLLTNLADRGGGCAPCNGLLELSCVYPKFPVLGCELKNPNIHAIECRRSYTSGPTILESGWSIGIQDVSGTLTLLRLTLTAKAIGFSRVVMSVPLCLKNHPIKTRLCSLHDQQTLLTLSKMKWQLYPNT